MMAGNREETTEQPCLEEHLAEIATSITEWREISPFLGLTEAEEHEILGSAPHSVRSQKIAMLRMWKKKKGKGATYKRLSLAFRKGERFDLECKIMTLLAEISEVSTIEHSDPIMSYGYYLKELYMSMSQGQTSQHWTHLPHCEFVKLAMITGAQGLRRGGPEEDMIRLAQQGKIETILGHKSYKSIDLLTLLPFPPKSPQPLVVLPPPPPGRVCLIEGAPGGGKSTLALYICQQWAQNASWLEKIYDVVVLVYLREQAIQTANTLADILPGHNSEMSQTVATQIKACCGKNVLFVFDGWDEFPHQLMNNSLVSTIIRQPRKLSLHHSTILITSRPVASGNLLHIADQRVEILGFTQHQIREYIEKALDGNITQIQKLVQHLQRHPVIEGYCYIPLHVAILVHIFLTMKGALPTTLHELFCSLLLCCIIREQVTREPGTCLPEISSLDDLPSGLKSELSNLSTLAYNGVMQDKAVFYSKDLQASHLPGNLRPSLGLLQAVEGLTLYSKSLSYNFLHLSVQELLAAYNISRMTSSEQVEVFKRLFESSRFEAVLHYYCGFTKLANPEIQTFISSFQIGKSCFNDLLPLLHCFFQAQNPSLCQLVDPRFLPQEYEKLNLGELTPVDFSAVGYFVTSLLSKSTANTPTMHLVIDGIDDFCFKMLLNESKHPSALSLKLTSFSFTAEDNFSALSNEILRVNKSLTHLDLSNNILTDSAIRWISEGFKNNTTLVNLNLSDIACIISDPDTIESLAEMLQVNQSLTHLNLSKNTLSDSVMLCISEGLQCNTILANLDLSRTSIIISNMSTARSLTKMLQVNKSLKHLNLSNIYCSHAREIVLCVFDGLKHNDALRYLDLQGVTGVKDTVAKHVAEALQFNRTLQTLDISKCSFLSRNGIAFIMESLMLNCTLQTMYISDIDSETIIKFKRKREAKHLPSVDILQTVD